MTAKLQVAELVGSSTPETTRVRGDARDTDPDPAFA